MMARVQAFTAGMQKPPVAPPTPLAAPNGQLLPLGVAPGPAAPSPSQPEAPTKKDPADVARVMIESLANKAKPEEFMEKLKSLPPEVLTEALKQISVAGGVEAALEKARAKVPVKVTYQGTSKTISLPGGTRIGELVREQVGGGGAGQEILAIENDSGAELSFDLTLSALVANSGNSSRGGEACLSISLGAAVDVW